MAKTYEITCQNCENRVVCPNYEKPLQQIACGGDYCFFLSFEKRFETACEEIRQLTAELTALREANRWISVEERLPEESGRYLVNVNRIASECLGGNSNFMRIKMFMNGEWAYGTHSPVWINGELKDCVTHWRPLPTVPEKEE